MILSKEFRFEASHQIPNHLGKCARLHGHSWVLHVFVEGAMDHKTFMVKDYYDIKQVVEPVIEMLDHQHLGHHVSCPNTVIGMCYGFVPTSENLLLWIADQLDESFPWSALSLQETCTCKAVLARDEWLFERLRKEVHSNGQKEGTDEGNEERKGSGEETASQAVAPADFITKPGPGFQEALDKCEITDDDIPF